MCKRRGPDLHNIRHIYLFVPKKVFFFVYLPACDCCCCCCCCWSIINTLIRLPYGAGDGWGNWATLLLDMLQLSVALRLTLASWLCAMFHDFVNLVNFFSAFFYDPSCTKTELGSWVTISKLKLLPHVDGGQNEDRDTPMSATEVEKVVAVVEVRYRPKWLNGGALNENLIFQCWAHGKFISKAVTQFFSTSVALWPIFLGYLFWRLSFHQRHSFVYYTLSHLNAKEGFCCCERPTWSSRKWLNTLFLVISLSRWSVLRVDLCCLGFALMVELGLTLFCRRYLG